MLWVVIVGEVGLVDFDFDLGWYMVFPYVSSSFSSL
jgi:hypothetical protein